MPTRQLPAPQQHRGPGRALTPSGTTHPARILGGLANARLVPLAQRSLAVAGAALAAEYALRVALSGPLERLLAPVRAAPTIIRTEVTEWVIVERLRRR